MPEGRSQAAVEYLITYGWAIIIIGVVVIVFYSLGLFDPYTYAPKAGAGTCYVVRPQAVIGVQPYLSGDCKNEVPNFVAQFNGKTSYVVTGDSYFALGDAQRSAVMWIYLRNVTTDTIPEGYGTYSTTDGKQYVSIWSYGFTTLNPQILFGDNQENFYGPSNRLNGGQWYFIGYSYSGGASNTVTVYLDNISQTFNMGVALNTTLPATQAAFIGAGLGGYDYGFFNGSIANVQVYNTSLSTNEIEALYKEGIGGAPINLQNLVGWWPLDGNANDYSGNNNTGTGYNVSYSNKWYNGYTTP